MDLNSQQLQAVQAIDGYVLLLAVPGSGKTTVLVQRLGHMINDLSIPASSILTITYTVAATNDMRRRFISQFGQEAAEGLEFRTINGISQKIISYFGKTMNKAPFEVADSRQISYVIKETFQKVTGSYPTENDIREVSTAICYCKNMELSEEEIREKDKEIPKFSKIYEGYNKRLRDLRLIDFDDQMIFALRILKLYEPIRDHFQKLYQYILVDEAQDTSKIQHQIIELLAKKSGNLFMVGDEDQSIYGFRAAFPKALTSFEKRHPDATVLFMESNYRSNSEIVDAADRLIAKNKDRHAKHMESTKGEGGRLARINAKTRRSQYNYLLKVAATGEKETAVLYRNSESVLPLVDLLERNGIPYKVRNSEMTFFTHPIVQDIKDFITLALHPCDEEAFLRIYYKMGAGISKQMALEAIRENYGEMSLIDTVAQLKSATPFVAKQCKALHTHFVALKNESCGRAVFRIVSYMGYGKYMEDRKMDKGKAEILRIIGDQIANIADFSERLKMLSEIVANGSRYSDEESQFVLSTIHSAKGLEFERVYLLDMVDSVMEETEEERRLYYVGMTRAINELFIFTYADMSTCLFSKEVFGLEKVMTTKPSFTGSGPAVVKKQAKYSDGEIITMMKDYKAGTKLSHKKFGQGVIEDLDGDMMVVNFDGGQTKKISLKIALMNNMVEAI